MATEFLFLADHPALDFLNTVAIVGDTPKDFLFNDKDVLDWLDRAGFAVDSRKAAVPHGGLLRAAHHLRDITRSLVEQRKAGRSLDLDAINQFLARASSHLQLVANEAGTVMALREYGRKTAEEVLGPLAETIADFLTTSNFDLVRHCEGAGCILWFYDRTKSHRRRWCSMAVCGNRHKVSTFRARQPH